MDEDLDSIIGILNAPAKTSNPSGTSGNTFNKEEKYIHFRKLIKKEIDMEITSKENALTKNETNVNSNKETNSGQTGKILFNEDNGEDEDVKNYKFSDEGPLMKKMIQI